MPLASEEAKYLDQLVADLLVFSQVMVNGTGVDKSQCDLNEIVAEVLLKCREMPGNTDVAVDFIPGALPPLQLDVSKIRFALLQVVDNAFKFSGKPGRVTSRSAARVILPILLSQTRESGSRIARYPRCLKNFIRSIRTIPVRYRGFGLGLFYAREFIRQHGGSITLASELGSGTTVTINLPMKSDQDEG